jgi:hypothetical protein
MAERSGVPMPGRKGVPMAGSKGLTMAESKGVPSGAPRRATVFWAALLLVAIALPACDIDTDFAEDLVEKTAERNQRRLLEQQRAELPLPDPDEVPYITVTAPEIELDEDFHVNLIDDLVIGAGRREPEYLFVRFSGSSAALGNIAVDKAGNVYVLETRSYEVRVFDPDGEFLFKFGQRGQGPGDFQSPFGIDIAGDHVHVMHRRYYDSIWDLQGNFLREREILRTPEAAEWARREKQAREDDAAGAVGTLDERAVRRFRLPTQVIGRPDGSQITVFDDQPGGQVGRISTPYIRVAGRFEDGAEVERYIEVPGWAAPSFAVTLDGEMYVGMFGHLRTEHYIVALDAKGQPRWVVTAPWDVDTPPRADLRVGPRGRLFVFPNFRATTDETRSPVQVYSRDGELLGSGYLNRIPTWLHWQQTTAEHVWGVRVNRLSEEWEVVRYRLEVSR